MTTNKENFEKNGWDVFDSDQIGSCRYQHLGDTRDQGWGVNLFFRAQDEEDGSNLGMWAAEKAWISFR